MTVVFVALIVDVLYIANVVVSITVTNQFLPLLPLEMNNLDQKRKTMMVTTMMVTTMMVTRVMMTRVMMTRVTTVKHLHQKRPRNNLHQERPRKSKKK